MFSTTIRNNPIKKLSPKDYTTLVSTPTTTTRKIIPIDATWYLSSPHNPETQFLTQDRLPQAAYFDLDKHITPSPYPHMFPPPQVWNSMMEELGIRNGDEVVIYDRLGVFSGCRVAFMFAVAGSQSGVGLLHTYLKYIEEGYEVDKAPVESVRTGVNGDEAGGVGVRVDEEVWERNYRNWIIEYDEVLKFVKNGNVGREVLIFDARPNKRFMAEVNEPRPGIKSGHIPGSLSLPFSSVITDQGLFKTPEEIREVLKQDLGIGCSGKELVEKYKGGIIASCGSGVTACVIKFAIESALGVPVRVYDGSWSEYGHRTDEEFVETGPGIGKLSGLDSASGSDVKIDVDELLIKQREYLDSL